MGTTPFEKSVTLEKILSGWEFTHIQNPLGIQFESRQDNEPI